MCDVINKRGFTLIEVLAAVVLIAGAIVPMARALTQSMIISTKEERLNKVIFLAERKLEELRNKILYDFDENRDQKQAVSFEETDLDPNPDYCGYKYTVDDTVIEDEDSRLKEIQVQVWYDEDDDDKLDSNEESITLDTKIAER